MRDQTFWRVTLSAAIVVTWAVYRWAEAMP
jgi:hypothetical protein